ncbi:alkane 1-monooxygenase [Halorubrum ezzemoulense]|uniref:Alkane 1-monooxygenase n=2 Tax=Halorubrum ezzemoulense TaxID=337243 RepID=A0A1X4HC15_HALEZ|nr:MsnO8 family LLM class oxidoreductase [Halorubrum ezzemoulense]MDB2238034.1 MsnO8 family LLM class oxidoreductase [Halorubrum ezzemoulense]MDB2247503.1 MsnO8 family LLM class oxidoreductase [Halorubrum ezzemoulense]OSP11169.1 alkane 1-monooxygenase [Halorubrum ezzemoulense DSM 17463]OYR60989.1 alkane 1-monooxygenase [Halorubrum ezzemoulense]
MDLSVVDLSPVPRGGTAADAFANTVDAARHAERLGYERFWVAEHHGMGDRLAGTTPEVLLGRVAGATDSIRIGSGAVLLNHYSPFKVAESFGVLDGLAPGRVDLGMGRANGSPASDRALGTDRRVENPNEDHRERITAVVNHLRDAYPDEHPYADLSVPGSAEGPAVPWVLGSSPASGEIAGELGLRYCFAGFIRPGFAERAFAAYREAFDPDAGPGGLDEPQGMVAVNAVAAETDAAAARRRAPAEATFRRMKRSELGDETPTEEEAIDELGGAPDPTPATLDDDEWPRSISGSPETMSGLLEQLADRVGVDEVMIQHTVPDREAALDSHALLAEAMDLDPRAD